VRNAATNDHFLKDQVAENNESDCHRHLKNLNYAQPKLRTWKSAGQIDKGLLGKSGNTLLARLGHMTSSGLLP